MSGPPSRRFRVQHPLRLSRLVGPNHARGAHRARQRGDPLRAHRGHKSSTEPRRTAPRIGSPDVRKRSGAHEATNRARKSCLDPASGNGATARIPGHEEDTRSSYATRTGRGAFRPPRTGGHAVSIGHAGSKGTSCRRVLAEALSDPTPGRSGTSRSPRSSDPGRVSAGIGGRTGPRRRTPPRPANDAT